MTQVKFELVQVKKDLHFMTMNRGDLEMALASVQEEKKVIERELLAIRA